MKQFVRDSAVTYWHQSCTAKMGRDAMSVVDASLRVYEVEGLRIADASIMPRVTTGNTQAPAPSSASVPPERSVSFTAFNLSTRTLASETVLVDHCEIAPCISRHRRIGRQRRHRTCLRVRSTCWS